MSNFFFIFTLFCFINIYYSQGKLEITNQNNAPSIPQTNGNAVNSSNTIILSTDSLQLFEEKSDNYEETIILKKNNDKSNNGKDIKSRAKSKSVEFKNIETAEDKFSSAQAIAVQQFSLAYQKSRMQDSRRSPTTEQQNELDKSIQILKNIDSNSFDYHLNKFIAGNYNLDLKNHLEKASELNLSDTRVLNQLNAISIIECDTAQSIVLLTDLINNGILDQSYVDYGMDVLLSAPTNSTLITHSFNDSYGVYFNQFSNSLRPDVMVINLDFCQSKQYRKNLLKKGYIIPSQTVVDTRFLADFIQQNPNKSFALSNTLPQNYFINSPINLNSQGLVFSNLTESDKNIELWESELRKKILFQNTELSKKLASNYLPLLLDLRKKYMETNQIEKVREVDKIIDKISNGIGKERQINQMKNRN